MSTPFCRRYSVTKLIGNPARRLALANTRSAEMVGSSGAQKNAVHIGSENPVFAARVKSQTLALPQLRQRKVFAQPSPSLESENSPSHELHGKDRRQSCGDGGPSVAAVAGVPQPTGGRAEGQAVAAVVDGQGVTID